MALQGRSSTIKTNGLPRMRFLFQTILVWTIDTPIKSGKGIAKFVQQGGGETQVKNKVFLKNAKQRERLGLLVLKLYFAPSCLIWI